MASETLDWNEIGTLERALPGGYAYAIRTDLFTTPSRRSASNPWFDRTPAETFAECVAFTG